MTQLTELLGRIQAGDPQARDALFASAYSELHRLAHARLRDGGRNTVLDTTCLVHESYLRFVRAGELRAEDRRAFFAYASQVMRSVIVNSVRERIAQKRGGDSDRRSRYPTVLRPSCPTQRRRFWPCTRRSRLWSKPIRVWRRSRRCATLAATASRKLPKRWRLPNARYNATGRRRG